MPYVVHSSGKCRSTILYTNIVETLKMLEIEGITRSTSGENRCVLGMLRYQFPLRINNKVRDAHPDLDIPLPEN